MPIKTLSTRRTQAASAISSSAVSFNNPDGSGFAISGTGVTSNTTIKSVPVTVGLSSAASTTTVSPPVITSFNVASDSSYTTILDDVAIDTGGAYIKINGTNFSNTGLLVYFNGSNVTNTYISSNEVRATIPATTAGSYNLMMFNGSRGAILTNVTVSGFPSWTSSTYSNLGLTVSVQLLATGDAPLSYSLYSGSLPSGVTLSSDGLISGTASAAGVYSFTALVDDAQLQTTQQAITLTISTTDPYWKNTVLLINGETGTSAFDDSSNNNVILTFGGDVQPANTSPFASPTLTDGSVFFDGSGDYLTNTSFTSVGTSPFTLEHWVYVTSYVNGQTFAGIFDTRSSGSDTTGFSTYFRSSSSTLVFRYGGSEITIPWTNVPLNTWTHIAVVRDGTNAVQIYINGTKIGAPATGVTNNFNNNLVNIGRTFDPFYYTGFISNLRLTKQVLYSANTTITTSALTTTSQGANSANVILLTCQTNVPRENNRILDYSANSIPVVRNSNPAESTFNPNGSNWSGYFDGNGDYLEVANAAPLLFNTNDFTVEAWIYLTDITTTIAPIVVKGGSTTDWALAVNITSARLYFGIGTNDFLINTGPVVSLNAWHHIAWVRSGSTMQIFLDGVSGGTVTNMANNFVSTGAVRVARGRDTSTNYAKGYISNVRIVNGTALYTSNFTPSIIPITTTSQSATANQVVLLTCQSNQFKDNGNNSYTITRTGDAAVTSFSPFGGAATWSPSANGASISLNGTSDYLSLANDSRVTWGAGDFTFETWIYLNSSTTPSAATVWDHRNGTNGIAVVQPYVGLDTTVGYSFYTRATTRFSSGTAAIKHRQWQHLAIVRSSGVTRMYLDGIQTGVSYTDSDNYPGGTVRISQANDGVSTRFFPGYFYNMRLVVGTAIYTSNTTINTAPINAVANTRLLLKAIPGVQDLTGQVSLLTTNAEKRSTTEKFGTGSIYFDGSGDYVTALANSASGVADPFGFNTGDFTIEGWLYTTTVASGRKTICASRATATDTTTGRFSIYANTANLEFFSASANVVFGGTISTNTWTHFAVTRSSGNVRLFLSGTQVGSTTSYTASLPSNLALTVGDNAAGTESWNGYLDELRITKGYARYIANFTIPSSAYPQL